MRKKKKIFLNDNISIKEILKIFLKEKITIIVISLAFSISFGILYYYGINQIKKSQKLSSVKVTLVNEDLKYLSMYYDNFTPENYLLKRGTDFKTFKFEISNLNLVDFFRQNRDRFDDFSNYFNKSNIKAQDYFFKNFKKKGKNYYFEYPSQLQGETLVNEFMISEIYRYEKELKNIIKRNLVIQVNFIEKINQILIENDFDNDKEEKKYTTSWNIFKLIDDNHNYENTIFMTKKILKALDDNILNYPFTFNFLTEVTTLKNKYTINSLKNFILVGLVFGFFLSLIIVFFKNLIRKNIL